MEKATKRARKCDNDTHELKNKRVFSVLNCRENKNILSLKEI